MGRRAVFSKVNLHFFSALDRQKDFGALDGEHRKMLYKGLRKLSSIVRRFFVGAESTSKIWSSISVLEKQTLIEISNKQT